MAFFRYAPAFQKSFNFIKSFAALLKHNDMNRDVGSFMTRNYHFAHVGMSRGGALDYLRAVSIRHLPILDKDKVVVGLHTVDGLIGRRWMKNAALIMAGGRGVRLLPLTETTPKPMLPVAGRPILEHILFHLVGSGIRKIFLSVNYLWEQIEARFGNGSRYGCEIAYLREKCPLGTAGALSLLPRDLGDPLLVLNGDLITQFDIEQILAHHGQAGNVITIGARDHSVKIPYGVLHTDGDEVLAIAEKPESHHLVNGGVYVLDPSLPATVPGDREYPMTELIECCLREKKKVGYHLIDGDWVDVGEHRQLARARGEHG